MAFIKFKDVANYEKGRDYVLSVPPRTILHGRGGKETTVYCVDWVTLLELNNQGIEYRELRESDLQAELSERAYRHFEIIKKKRPESLYFNEEIPPLGQVKIELAVEPSKTTTAKDIIGLFGEVQTESDEITQIAIGKFETDISSRVRITAFVSENDLDSLVKQLASERIAGYDRGIRFMFVKAQIKYENFGGNIMKIQKFNMADITKRLKKAWTPINVETIDHFILRIAKFKGTYHWHKHQNEDELFIVLKGKIKIQTNHGNVTLNQGEGVKIPKGVKHCPIATQPSVVLMFENSKLEGRRN